MGEKIYVITRGNYSDYHIVGATTDKEKAEEFMRLYNSRKDCWNSCELETYDDSLFYYVANGYMLYSVHVWKDKTMVYNETWSVCLYDDYNDGAVTEARGGYHTYVYAKDEDHAKKIAYDRIAKYKAEKEGL